MAQGPIKFLLLALLLGVFGCQGKPSTPPASPTGDGGNQAAGSGAGAEAPSQQWADSGVPEAQVLSKLLRSEDVSVRRWACEKLVSDRAVGKIQTAAAEEVSALALALSDPDDQVRFWAAVALGHIGPPAAPAIPALTERIKQDPLWTIRAESVQAVARAVSTGEEALPAILAALADEDEQVQSKGAYALGQVEHWGPGAVPALTKLLEDERTWVRARAAESLSRVGPPAKAAAPALKKLADDDDAHVRLSARDALAKILNEG